MTTLKQDNINNKDDNILWQNKNILDLPIYRVFSIKKLIKVIKTGKNVLVKPELWDDPFENILAKLKGYATKSKMSLDLSAIFGKFYGQCWTLNVDETDALWRIYSPKKDGVRVKSTIKKIFDSFYNINDKYAQLKYFIGKIEYYSEQDIINYLQNPQNLWNIIFDSTAKNHTIPLLIKRKEFEHENEVRLLFNSNDKKRVRKIFQYKIDINTVFDELLFDPRMNDKDYLNYTKTIKQFGFNNKIEKSSLYNLKNINLNVDI